MKPKLLVVGKLFHLSLKDTTWHLTTCKTQMQRNKIAPRWGLREGSERCKRDKKAGHKKWTAGAEVAEERERDKSRKKKGCL